MRTSSKGRSTVWRPVRHDQPPVQTVNYAEVTAITTMQAAVPTARTHWDAYAGYASRFYDDLKASGLWYLAVARLVGKRNSISGTLYRDDPAIMGWQLANEPRAMTHRRGYEQWVRQAAALIKSIDPAHLVTIGSEGETPYKDYVHADFVKDHKTPGIDFATVHIWPSRNWGWFSVDGSKGDLRNAQVRSIDYLNRHVKYARDDLRMPLLLEEFGFPRDGGSCEASSGTSRRNSYYATLLDAAVASAASGGLLAGALFWGWGGEGGHASGARNAAPVASRRCGSRATTCCRTRRARARAGTRSSTPTPARCSCSVDAQPHGPPRWHERASERVASL